MAHSAGHACSLCSVANQGCGTRQLQRTKAPTYVFLFFSSRRHICFRGRRCVFRDAAASWTAFVNTAVVIIFSSLTSQVFAAHLQHLYAVCFKGRQCALRICWFHRA
jgi:hypothetical protein